LVLHHAGSAPRPINIALIGTRASGKTSLLNFTEAEAEARTFFTVRINLDAGIAANQFSFFHSIMDSIIQKACQQGYFNGIHGRIYDSYLDLVSAYAVPETKEFCLFLFPIRFAKAMQSGTTPTEVPNNVIQHDLEVVRNEIKRPIILIFDECNTMINHKELLQKLRNIFMNTPGFMLVFAGTDELFPLMDEVFSPIIRQFKKIVIREFIDVDDTRECIKRPLEALREAEPDKYFDFKAGAVREIHDLTGGRPYEIQLLCHIMFRRVQEKRAKQMALGVAVLDDVRRELESAQSLSDRPILTAVGRLTKDELAALRVLVRSCGRASFDDAWNIEYIANGNERWTRQKLEENYNRLISLGILRKTEDKIEFNGDEFDKIYTKYLSLPKRQRVSVTEIPLDFLVMVLISDKIGEKFVLRLGKIGLEEVNAVVEALAADRDVFSEHGAIARIMYSLMVEHRHDDPFLLRFAVVRHPWGLGIVFIKPEADEGEVELPLAGIRGRLLELGGSLEFETRSIKPISLDDLVQKVETTKNERARDDIVAYHVRALQSEYVDNNNPDEAYFNGKLAFRLAQKLNAEDRNDLGYVAFATGHDEEAKDLFLSSIESWQGEYKPLLPTYNLAMLLAKEGDIHLSLERLDWCIENGKDIPKRDRGAVCLFTPSFQDGSLKILEVRGELDLLRLSVDAKNVLKKMQRSRSET
jgi:hypothetical protein